ncbi:MAG: MFS transporter, partial [Nonomuraea sp.]|nr:MFS transporter [Nonomuraea sp.]
LASGLVAFANVLRAGDRDRPKLSRPTVPVSDQQA